MKKTGIILLSMVLAASCIKNDMSYPRILADITAFEVEGQKNVTIDASARTVVVELEETADIEALKLVRLDFTESAEMLTPLDSVLNLSEPDTLTLRTYQDYVWTISAIQPIERYISVDNQVGDAEFDVSKREAYVYVTEDQDLMKIRINDMKLEAEGSYVLSSKGQISVGGVAQTDSAEVNFPATLDCVVMRTFYVKHKEDTLGWNVKFLNKVVDLEVSFVNAWCYSAEISAVSKGGEATRLEYKTSSASSWIEIEDKTVDGIKVSATLTRLKAGTQYVVRVINGEEISEDYSFKTDTPTQLDNMNFDNWSQPDGKTWYPFLENQTNAPWGTANPGTSIMIANTTSPEYSHVHTPGGAAARIESMYVAVAFAAGNIFTGEFVEFTDMTAKLHWGTPFTSRPYSLKGYMDYAPKIVDNAPEKISLAGNIANPYRDQMGKPDHCQIMVALIADGESDEEKGPYNVSSKKPGVPDLKNDSRVIAYGAIESDVSTNGEYVEFECVLDYRDTRTPSYIIVVACSSLRGDYFTGGVGSVLYVDDFEFIYK